MKSLMISLLLMFAVAACATDDPPEESIVIAPSIVNGQTISPPLDWRPGDPFPETLIVDGVEEKCDAKPVPGSKEGGTNSWGCWCTGHKQMCCMLPSPPFWSCHYGHVCREPELPEDPDDY